MGLDALADMVDYMVNLAGYEHVGIGTDFEFLEDVVEGFSGVARDSAVSGRAGSPGATAGAWWTLSPARTSCG